MTVFYNVLSYFWLVTASYWLFFENDPTKALIYLGVSGVAMAISKIFELQEEIDKLRSEQRNKS